MELCELPLAYGPMDVLLVPGSIQKELPPNSSRTSCESPVEVGVGFPVGQ